MNKLYKNWPIHNIVGHPVSQILKLVGAERAALWVHDITAPHSVEEQEPASARELVIALLEEIPADTVLIRGISGDIFTAGDIIEGIKNGDNFSKQWTADFLRVSRDILRKRAEKERDLDNK